MRVEDTRLERNGEVGVLGEESPRERKGRTDAEGLKGCGWNGLETGREAGGLGLRTRSHVFGRGAEGLNGMSSEEGR